MEWQLRPVAPGDETGVAETVKECFLEYGLTWEPEGYHADLYNLAGYFSGEEGRFWVAEVGGAIVGCGGIAWMEEPGAPLGELVGEYPRIGGCQAEIVRMYVRGSARRQGIAGAIFDNVLGAAQDHGVRALEIWSDKRFLDAHRMYEARGAVRVGERICDDPDDSPEWGFYLLCESPARRV